MPFFESGIQHLDELVRDRLLCAFDFDGTLAPIVTRPEAARMPPGTMQRLAELTRYAPVAIITGRSVADVRERLQFQPDFIVGNHGLEGVPDSSRHREDDEAMCAGWLQALSTAVTDPGVRLENKGCSLSVHYRLARDHAKAEANLADLLGRLAPQARIVAGKCVFNVMPPDAPHKGDALQRLMQSCNARYAIYAGDDVTDEDVFRMRRPDVLSIRIGRAADSEADFFLHHRLDMFRLLDELIKRLREARASNWLRTASGFLPATA
ncbi:trehalose-phosphatase [Noviherbaspirillum sp.]|uniref:trehalose-phosphatase n=1 Tax=Noviherbaspirillum sp. TaxID=1926288 RepID=UPI002FE0C573